MGRPRQGGNLLDPMIYRICISGSLDEQWSAYYGGMRIEQLGDPTRSPMTLLSGRLADQSALIGVLNLLHDMGCPILSVQCVAAG